MLKILFDKNRSRTQKWEQLNKGTITFQQRKENTLLLRHRGALNKAIFDNSSNHIT